MGSDSKNGSNVAGGAPQIPAAAKKMVQNLKEIVNKNCTDSEIYAVLLECNMDPDEAVQRLLSQETFKEVKSKRDRRKEMKETQESRARCNVGTYNRGVRFGTEQVVGQTGSMENNYNELGKTAYKREMGSVAPSLSSSYMYRATGKIISEKPSTHSEFVNSDNRRQSIGTSDTISSSVQPSLALQPTLPGISKGHVSMADIVRGNRPQNKDSQMLNEIPCTTQHVVLPNLSHYHNKSPHVFSSPESELHQGPNPSHPSNLSEMIQGSGMTAGWHDFDNERPVIDHLPVSTGSLVIDASAASDAELFSNDTSLYSNRAKFPRNPLSDDVQVLESDFDSQNLSRPDSNGFASASHRQIFANSAGDASCGDLHKETSTYDTHELVSKHQEGIGSGSNLLFPNCSASLNDDVISGASSAMANMQQLNLGKEEPAMQSTEDRNVVVLPDHFHAFAADCSHLSFGTYKSGGVSASAMAVASNLIRSNLEVTAADGSSSSAVNSSFRNSEHRDREQLGIMYDTRRVTAGARNYDLLVSSHPVLMKQDIPETARKHQYICPLAVPDSSTKKIQQSGSNFPFVVDPNVRNLSSVPSEMHSESIPTNLLGLLPTQSLNVRDPSPFLPTQSLLSGYSTSVPSINDRTISMSEDLNSGMFALPQLPSQALPSSNLAKGTVLPQHQPVHSYTQPTLPLGELANVISYPSMSQSQAYVPSALQQVYTESSVFRDPQAGMNYNLVQYRSGGTMGGLPLSNNNPTAYGSFVGSYSNAPGSFSHNLSTSQTGVAVGYDSLVHSRYKDGNGFTKRQQVKDNRSSAWDLGVGPQTMSMLTDDAYYSLLGQNPQYAGHQHDQQASQHYESHGYPNTYHPERNTGTPRPW